MSGIIKKIVFVFTVLVVISGSAWGGWFSFEPNMVLLDGTAVARYLEDIGQENVFLKNGDKAKAEQLILDEKVYRIKSGQDQTRVKFLGYEEYEGSVFVQVQDESGSKLWTSISGLACVGQDGKERNLTKEDVIKGEFKPLPK